MPRYFQRLLFTLAGATEDDLRRQIQFLKAENEMLRTRVPTKIIRLTPPERARLLRLGRRHLDYVVSEFVDYYSTKRPHQAVGNRPLTPSGSPSDRASPNAGEVVCEERLGGLLRHYYHAAA